MMTEISRTFGDLSEKDIAEVEQAEVLGRWGMARGFGWDTLLTARRILIVSEAGVGKTYECRACQQRLWASGEPAFFLELATLADEDPFYTFTTEERDRFDAWTKAQSEIATFFLDSIDELKISQKSFEQALKRLARRLAGNLNRARIVITTRPIPVDQEMIVRHLPIPPSSEAASTPEYFADVAMRRDRKEKSDDSAPKDWRNVRLMPLTSDQIKTFAEIQGVTDAEILLADIKRRHAEEYAQRPQDLIELCYDWKEHRRIRKHGDQVAANVINKLKARTDRAEKAQLSDERAFEGASRLALAALLTRKLTIRYSAESDRIQSVEAALDAGKILTNWTQPEKDTLLERGLFGFANYGRVRFHHRSVLEYLAAKRLDALLTRGVPIRAVKRILFTDTVNGDRVVRPSLRAVAAWLSLWHEGVYREVLTREPDILLNQGDPESLSSKQRAEVLNAYVIRYRKGGWRGLSTPIVQVHRFATADLDTTVREIWTRGVENWEIRDLLFELIGAAKLVGCADLVYGVAIDSKAPHRERLAALDALIALKDRRLAAVARSIEKSPKRWPPAIARSAALSLFPVHLSVQQLCAILPTVQESRSRIGELSWQLPQLVAKGAITPDQLDGLRNCLTTLVLDGAEWDDHKWPNWRTKRPDLIPSLIETCNRQFREGVRTKDLFRSGVIALRFTKSERVDDEPVKQLQGHFAESSPTEREQAFWDDHAFMQTIRPAKDALRRVYMLSHHGGIRLSSEKDREWVIHGLSDKQRSAFEREMMLWAAMVEVMLPGEDVVKAHEDLKKYVADIPTLTTIIENRLKPTPVDEELKRLEERSRRQQRKSEKDQAKAHLSWVKFWKEIADHPDDVFADARAENTAWNLWQTMERSGSDSRAAGWNRRFIERQFGPEIANRLRSVLLRMWRKDKPTLRSERPVDQKNTFLVKWQLGLAAIYAEAEDSNWAEKLSDEEARLASRFVPLELNGFPSWLDALVAAHPSAVDAVLGSELSLALREDGTDSDPTILLQNIRHATPRVMSTFAPRIKAWVNEVQEKDFAAKSPMLGRLTQAVEILMQTDELQIREDLRKIADSSLAKGLDRPIAKVWLPILMQLDPQAGVEALEGGLKNAPISQRGVGVDWFATLFGTDHRGGTVELRRPEFAPHLLLRLVRLAYMHVRPADDAHHEGSYSPDERDHAERGRDAVLSALLAANGAEGWAAKQAMAADPLFAHFKDRVLALARERAAEEADGSALSESELVALDSYGEVPPATRDEMFAIMRDRLDDLEDLLLQDESPREMWSGISDEKVMRRAIARELRISRNHMYTVDQEAATADEKETDVRLRAARSNQQAVIELKIGEKPRTAKELRATITDQLVKKYMAPDECRAGCLLITVARDKEWAHPSIRGRRLDFPALIAFLQGEANRVASNLGGSVRLLVKGLDLRPRLTTEMIARVVAKRKKTRRGPGRLKTNAHAKRKAAKRKRRVGR